MSSKYEQFLNTYSGQRLIERYSLEQEGTWRIRGEDPNCDFGGFHHSPELEIVEGRLKDVIEYGVSLPRFWQWGAGGDFELLSKPKKIDAINNKRREELKQQLAALEAQMQAVKRELGE